MRVLKGHTNGITSIAWSPRGNLLASGSNDKTVRLWDIETTGRVSRILEGHTGCVTNVAWSPDQKAVASASHDGTIRLWNVVSGKCFAILFATPDGWVAFTPDGRYNFGGNLGGSFWHVVGLCRFEVGEIDEFLPHLRVRDDEPLFSLDDAGA